MWIDADRQPKLNLGIIAIPCRSLQGPLQTHLQRNEYSPEDLAVMVETYLMYAKNGKYKGAKVLAIQYSMDIDAWKFLVMHDSFPRRVHFGQDIPMAEILVDEMVSLSA